MSCYSNQLILVATSASVYPAILTTHIRLLEQRSQVVASTEHSLSLYISNLHHHAIALVESSAYASEWEFTCAFLMPPSLEALVRGDYSKMEGLEKEYDLFAEGEPDDGVCFLTFRSRRLMHRKDTFLCTPEYSGNDDDTPVAFQRSTSNTDSGDGQPSCFHPPPSQPTLEATIMPPPLSITSPEPFWLSYIRGRLNKLIIGFVTSAFQLLWQPGDGASVIKLADIISHRQSLGDDQRQRLHILRRLVAIVIQEYTLLFISPASSYESAARDGALISQGRR